MLPPNNPSVNALRRCHHLTGARRIYATKGIKAGRYDPPLPVQSHFHKINKPPHSLRMRGLFIYVLFGLAIAVGVILNAGEKFVGKGLLIFYGNIDLLAV